jgi:mannan endo-1,4-beta-mannosidase
MAASAWARVLGRTGLIAVLAGCGLTSPQAPTVGAGGQHSAPGGSAAPARQNLPYDMSGLLDPTGGKFLGVEAQGAPSLSPVSSFAASVGRRPDLVGQYLSWGTSFDPQAVSRAWSYGALSYIAWEPYGTSIEAIADGQSDAYITRFAAAVRTLNLPVAISFGHEMNGNWYPWGTRQASAAGFVAAWRRIHNLFTQAGASNVIWVWNPNVIDAAPQVQLRLYWPGNSYVDWVGITGYFPASGPETFASLYGSTIAEVRRFTGKPFIIAETSVQTGPAEVQAARSLVAGVKRRADVLGFIWFDFDKDGVDWQVESRPVVRAALSRDVARLPLINPKR